MQSAAMILIESRVEANLAKTKQQMAVQLEGDASFEMRTFAAKIKKEANDGEVRAEKLRRKAVRMMDVNLISEQLDQLTALAVDAIRKLHFVIFSTKPEVRRFIAEANERAQRGEQGSKLN